LAQNRLDVITDLTAKLNAELAQREELRVRLSKFEEQLLVPQNPEKNPGTENPLSRGASWLRISAAKAVQLKERIQQTPQQLIDKLKNSDVVRTSSNALRERTGGFGGRLDSHEESDSDEDESHEVNLLLAFTNDPTMLEYNWAIVRIWLPGKDGIPTLVHNHGDGGVGHVSLEIPGRYWSWWPENDESVTMFDSFKSVPGVHHSLLEDELFERDQDPITKKSDGGRRGADLTFVFRSLDVSRMRHAMTILDNQVKMWNIHKWSCASTSVAIVRSGCVGREKLAFPAFIRGIEHTSGTLAPDEMARALWDLAQRRELILDLANPLQFNEQSELSAIPNNEVRLRALPQIEGALGRGIVYSRYSRVDIKRRNLM